jgi:hypothetical protein
MNRLWNAWRALFDVPPRQWLPEFNTLQLGPKDKLLFEYAGILEDSQRQMFENTITQWLEGDKRRVCILDRGIRLVVLRNTETKPEAKHGNQ